MKDLPRSRCIAAAAVASQSGMEEIEHAAYSPSVFSPNVCLNIYTWFLYVCICVCVCVYVHGWMYGAHVHAYIHMDGIMDATHTSKYAWMPPPIE
jgi:hypothetical protein